MLYDKEFLLKLDKQKNKTKYARITSLKFDETPIESIEGRVTGGSINLDGASALRRSCSLSMTAEQFNHSSYTWGLNTKFKLEIGLENQVDPDYPDVIWFKQGTYLITSFSTSSSTNNFTVSISGKDKMCLLNGEIGGSLESSVDFGTIEEESEDGIWTITKIPIPDIIRNLVHTYAKEPYHNIVINDLDVYGLELLEYRYEVPMYLYRFANESLYTNAFLASETKKAVLPDGTVIALKADLSDEDEKKLLPYLAKLVDGLGYPNPDPVTIDGQQVYLTRLKYGDTAGYRSTDLTYAGDLIANVGESVTSILDKIRNMLSEFEYFYDVDGRFVFQKKQSFTSTMWGGSTDSNEEPKYRESLALSAASSYTFSGGELITAFNNQPNLGNMRNDYSIWGERTGVSGAKIPVHMRYAIDVKPFYYKAMDGKIYVTDKATFENMKQAEKDRIIYEFYEKINSYTMKYNVPEELPAPKKLSDGSWSPGWWDIRDWYDYYSLLLNASPDYTMKWYSRNDYTGCVPAKSLSINYTYNISSNTYVWLLIRRSDGRYNPQHGSGNPSYNKRKCILYQSYYDDTAARGYRTEVVKDENGNAVTDYFMYPYAGCSDDHTYLEFLEGDIKRDGNTVYFYNPAFHGWDSYEDLVKEQIEKQFKEYEDQGILNCVDWRELIYQMAKDYYKHNQEDDFELKVAANNIGYYPTGMTGYEPYYIDIQGFWRQLYNPEINRKLTDLRAQLGLDENYNKTNPLAGLYAEHDVAQTTLKTYQTTLKELEDKIKEVDESDEQGYMTLYNQYKEKQAEVATQTNTVAKLSEKIAALEVQLETWKDNRENFGDDHWVTALKEAPETLNFWFDFLDTEGELSQFSVRKIGARPKAINDTNVKSIYFRDTPDVIFYTSEETPPLNNGYTAVQAPEEMFSISSQGKSAKDRLDELIYQHGYCTESASITAIPIYYLEPNTRVYVYDNKTGIDGDYIVSKITLPLTYNGTMSITATKAAETVR